MHLLSFLMGYISIYRSGKEHIYIYIYIYICYVQYYKKEKEKRWILATSIYYFTIYQTLFGPTCMEIGKDKTTYN
jgi:hypothetical protein